LELFSLTPGFNRVESAQGENNRFSGFQIRVNGKPLKRFCVHALQSPG
jgi:hypothetical protein